MISRRQFLRACMYTAPIALVVPDVVRLIVLPPMDGWRPLTLEEIVKRALRARAGRLADAIVQNNLLYHRIAAAGVAFDGRFVDGPAQLEMRARVRNIGEAFEGHLLDVGRDENAIRRYLTQGTSFDPGFKPEASTELLPGYTPLRWQRDYSAPRPLEPTIPMPEEFRVGGKLVEPVRNAPSVDAYYADHFQRGLSNA